MKIPLLSLVFLMPTLVHAGEGLDRSIAWSPDGRWIAYSVTTSSGAQAPAPGWIFGDTTTSLDPGEARKIDTGSRWKLWASRVDGAASVLIDENRDFLLPPAWSPNSRAVAFGRRGAEPNTIEVVVWEGPAKIRVIATRPVGDPTTLAFEGIAWSQDGQTLAVPLGTAPGLALIRADDGRQVNVVPGARFPVWSPESSQLACYVPNEGGEALVYLDSPLGHPRHLVEVGKAISPPVWGQDGLVTLMRGGRIGPRRMGRPVTPVDLVRVRVDSGQVDLLQSLASDPGIPIGREIEGVAIAQDRDGESLFWSTAVAGRDHHIVWYRPREGLIRNRLLVLDPARSIGSIQLSPSGEMMAVRLSDHDHHSPPLFFEYDGRGQKLRAIVPDDEARASWLSLLVDSATLALNSRPIQGAPVARPTLLPISGEMEPTGELPNRIRRIAGLGRTLCDRTTESGEATPDLAALIREARLFFDALRDDPRAALADLDAFEPQADTPSRRLAALGLRAQLRLACDEFDAADRTIAYLRATEPTPVRRLEWTGAGPMLTSEVAPATGWIATLEARSALLRKVASNPPEPAPVPEGHFNPDAMPGQGIDVFRLRPGEIRFGIPDGAAFIPPPPRVPAGPAEGHPPIPRLVPGITRPPSQFPVKKP